MRWPPYFFISLSSYSSAISATSRSVAWSSSASSVVPWGDNRAMVRCTAQLVKGVDVDGPLAKQLLELNGHLRFGAFAVDSAEHTVLFTHTILGGTTLDPDELIATLSDVALIADEYDDKLMQKYGGQRMLDLIEEAALERIMEKDPEGFDLS